MTKFWILFLMALSVFIIFLEAKLYKVGSTVFGLFSPAIIFVACCLAYLWVVVRSLFLVFESNDYRTMNNPWVEEKLRLVEVNCHFHARNVLVLNIPSILQRRRARVRRVSPQPSDNRISQRRSRFSPETLQHFIHFRRPRIRQPGLLLRRRRPQ